MKKIKIGIVGIGNCASALIQGIEYYKNNQNSNAIGLMHWNLGGYKPHDIDCVCAFDIDKRKVGKDLSNAIYSFPNCINNLCESVPKSGIIVQMGKILDGYSSHMEQFKEQCSFRLSEEKEPTKEDVVKTLKKTDCEILINYLPVGSEEATKFYAECALEAQVGFINCMPVFIVSDPLWAKKFKKAKIPIIGDDIKSQIGATIVHRVLTNLFKNRGVVLDRTYQLNTGGNTDFLNMLDRKRLISKKISKTEAVQSQAAKRLNNENIHIGPSDYVPWQKDNKICFIRMEGRIFGDIPIDLELRMSVQDSPNSAGVVIDAIRCLRLALDRGQAGILHYPSAYFMKHPPIQLNDDDAYRLTEAFIQGIIEKEEQKILKKYKEQGIKIEEIANRT